MGLGDCSKEQGGVVFLVGLGCCWLEFVEFGVVFLVKLDCICWDQLKIEG